MVITSDENARAVFARKNAVETAFVLARVRYFGSIYATGRPASWRESRLETIRAIAACHLFDNAR